MPTLYELTAKIVLEDSEFVRSLRDADDAASDFESTLDNVSGAADDAGDDLEDLADAIDESAEAYERQSEAADKSSGAMNDSAEAAGNAKEESSGLLSTLSSSSGVFASITSGLAAAVNAVAGIGLLSEIGNKIAAMVDASATLGDKIDKESQKLGLTTAEYQYWEFILQHNGTSLQTAAAAFRSMTQAAQEHPTFFTDIGISLSDLKTLTTGQLYEKVIEQLAAIEEPGKRAGAAMKIFGRNYKEFMPLLNSDVQSVGDFAAAVHAVQTAAAENPGALEAIGITAEQIKNSTPEQLLMDISAALDAIDDPGQRAGAAMAIFGEGYHTIFPLLDSDVTAVGQMKGRLDDLNGVMSLYMTKRSAAYVDAKYDADVAGQALENALSARFMDLFTQYYNWKADVTAWLAKFVMPEEYKNWTFDEVDAKIAELHQKELELKEAYNEYLNSPDKWEEGIPSVAGELAAVTQEIQKWQPVWQTLYEQNAQDAVEAEARASAAIREELEKRAQEYVEAYNQMRTAVQGFFTLFQEVQEPEEHTSLADMDKALQSQIDFNTRYKDAMQIIENYAKRTGQDMTALNAAIAGAGSDGAQYAIAMAEAITAAGDDERVGAVDSIVSKYTELQTTQDQLATALTRATGAFDDFAKAAGDDIGKIQGMLNDLVDDDYLVNIMLQTSMGYSGSAPAGIAAGLFQRRAIGWDYVPENDTPVLAHEGERIMTKPENEAYTAMIRSGAGGGTITIPVTTKIFLDKDEIGEAMTEYMYNEERRFGA